MAVIDPNAQQGRGRGINSGSDAQDPSTEKGRMAKELQDGRIVDLFAQKETLPAGVKSKLDKDEDAWTFAPPPYGRCPIKVFPAKEFSKIKPRDKDNPNWDDVYYSLAMECKVLDPKDLNSQIGTVFPFVNTIIGRGKNISTAAGLIGKLGYKIPDEADDKTIALMCAQAIKAEKVVEVELDWTGQYKDPKGDYKVAWKSRNEFPRDQDGEPMHVARYRDANGNEYDITARAEIKHWYSKGEASITPRVAGGGMGVPKLQPIDVGRSIGAIGNAARTVQPGLLAPEPGELQPIQPVNAGLAPQMQAPQGQAQTDLLALLEES